MMVSNVLSRWILLVASVILLGVLLWAGTMNTAQEEAGTQSDSVVEWIKTLDSQQPRDIQTATFALG
jgi:hypothetical protein